MYNLSYTDPLMVSIYLLRVVLMKLKYCYVDGIGVVPSISTQKQLNCSSRLLNCDCEQICPVLSVFNYLSILFVAIYMYGDMLSYIDEFNFVLSSIHALQQLYLPDHVFYGVDWNDDFSRSNFQHTFALSQFC